MHRNRALLLATGLSAAIAAASCAKQPAPTTVLQSDDLVSNGASFDPGTIVDDPSFTDSMGLARDQLQQFLERTPYDRESFLATYSSNGVRAVDAILASAQRYTINPLVFVVRAEMDQGLVGQEFYPIDSPARVEYVFGCGCAAGQSSCDPALAGFDVQVDCLGRALRQSLDEVSAQKHTSGGWGPGIAMTTLDGARVTPSDASTAALYQYTPLVDVNKAGGNWLFWNLWQKYAVALQYAGPPSTTPTTWIGDPCTVDGNCSFPNGVCATNLPGGLCTVSCTSDCPTNPSRGPSYCADFQGQGGFCLPVCNPAAPACRQGYSCQRVAKFGDATQGEYVCINGQ